MKRSFKVLDLFSGTGGFSHGFVSSGLGFETLLGIDVLPIAGQTFQKNHQGAVTIVSDIRKIRRADVAETLKLKKRHVDVIVGGPPCQGFSSIRPFRSSREDDPRNSLFEEFASFVNYFRPTVFVMENVVGLASHKDGRTLSIIEECFRHIGYDTDWRILNAASFGVPQKRERLIMIGTERGGEIAFPEPTHFFNSRGSRLAKTSEKRMPTGDLFVEPLKEIKPAVTVTEAVSDLPPISSGEEAVLYASKPRNDFQKSMRATSRNVTLHAATKHSKKMLEIISHSGKNIGCIPKHLISSGFSSSYSRLDGDEPAVTLTVNFVHPASNRCIHPEQDRALTPREGARLQSFEDSYVFCGNRSQVAKQIGNAVPPLLGKAIAGSILKML